jgi:hypothetical protein
VQHQLWWRSPWLYGVVALLVLTLVILVALTR